MTTDDVVELSELDVILRVLCLKCPDERCELKVTHHATFLDLI
jgi:hypothetical protein